VTEATAAAVIRDIQASDNSDNKMLELHAKYAPREAPRRARAQLACRTRHACRWRVESRA
jgi:hypothetical protein